MVKEHECMSYCSQSRSRVLKKLELVVIKELVVIFNKEYNFQKHNYKLLQFFCLYDIISTSEIQ
jgi:hypothetical protein